MRSTTGMPSSFSRLRSWRGDELVVDGDEVRVGRLGRRLELLELARAEVGVGVRPVAVLDGLADDGDAGGAQQLAQLGEVVAGLAGPRCSTRAAWRGGSGGARCGWAWCVRCDCAAAWVPVSLGGGATARSLQNSAYMTSRNPVWVARTVHGPQQMIESAADAQEYGRCQEVVQHDRRHGDAPRGLDPHRSGRRRPRGQRRHAAPLGARRPHRVRASRPAALPPRRGARRAAARARARGPLVAPATACRASSSASAATASWPRSTWPAGRFASSR